MDKELYDMFVDMIETGVVSVCNMPNRTIYNISSPYYDDDASFVSVYNENILNNLIVTYAVMVENEVLATIDDNLLVSPSKKVKMLADVKRLFKLCQAKMRFQMRNSARTGFIGQLAIGKEYH